MRIAAIGFSFWCAKIERKIPIYPVIFDIYVRFAPYAALFFEYGSFKNNLTVLQIAGENGF